jgi:hypothetical protein
VVGFVDLGLPYNCKQFLESGACAPNKPLSLWAPNIPRPLDHHVLSNLVIPIAHLPYHAPP